MNDIGDLHHTLTENRTKKGVSNQYNMFREKRVKKRICVVSLKLISLPSFKISNITPQITKHFISNKLLIIIIFYWNDIQIQLYKMNRSPELRGYII